MTYSNGHVPASALTNIGGKTVVTTPTANAWKRAKAALKEQHVDLEPAGGIGSGYRSLAVQQDFYAASHGDAAAAARVDLNPNSSISVAAPGYSSHGTGTRIDALFNGSSWPSTAYLAVMHHFGFTREFGGDDPNHFKHDGKTATSPLTAVKVYTLVKPGEGGYAVAERCKISFATLEKLNPSVDDWGDLKIGQKVRIK